jgi:hypothetical protein
MKLQVYKPSEKLAVGMTLTIEEWEEKDGGLLSIRFKEGLRINKEPYGNMQIMAKPEPKLVKKWTVKIKEEGPIKIEEKYFDYEHQAMGFETELAKAGIDRDRLKREEVEVEEE